MSKHIKKINRIIKQHDHQLKEKYLKRIEYLVGANNELARELTRVESEKEGNISVPNATADRILLEENF
jgi:hypothetical protein